MNATERIARSRACGRQGCPCARWKPGGNVHCPSHDDHNPSLSLSEAADGKVLVHDQAGCSQEAVIEALREQGLWPEPGANGRRPAPQIVATFDYKDERGQLLFQTVRLDPKDFRQRRQDGARGWV